LNSDPPSSQEPDWWDDLLPLVPHPHPPGAEEMLRLIAYDIADPRRLRRVAETCLDFGVRMQKSLFECWLDDDRFAQLWTRLEAEIDLSTDRLNAYTLDAGAARSRRTLGRQALVSEKRSRYIL
jgi:CRISPR-associated protein Cas2